MMKRRQLLYGTNLEGISTLVLTPSARLFHLFRPAFRSLHEGWWATGSINERTAVVRCPIGRHSADALWYAPDVRRVMLLGCCGSYNADVRIGDIVAASEVTTDSGARSKTTVNVPGIRQTIVFHVDTFSEQESPRFSQRLRKEQADVVDMETYPMLLAAESRQCEFGALHVVTDQPQLRPFHELDAANLADIAAGTERLIELELRVLRTGNF